MFINETCLILFIFKLLIELLTYGTDFSEQETEQLSLELKNQIINVDISTNFGYLKHAPPNICKKLNFKKKTLIG